MILFDTDVLIWCQRGNEKAAEAINKAEERAVSAQTYMELLQCAQNKQQQSVVIDFLQAMSFIIIDVNERMSSRATVYVEEYALSHGLRAGDALIAATAIEKNLPLLSSNKKHYQFIPNLQFEWFRP